MKDEWKKVIDNAVESLAIARKTVLVVDKLPSLIVDDYIAQELQRQIETMSNQDLADICLRVLEIKAGAWEGGSE